MTDAVTGRLNGSGPVRDTLREMQEVNLHIRLRIFQLLSHADFRTFSTGDVALVYIDDETHWQTLAGVSPTNRSYLAALIRNLVPYGPTAIGLDIELLAPLGYGDGQDDWSRWHENEDLLQAIKEAAVKGVPVVLGAAYIEKDGGAFRLPGIFREEDLRSIDKRDCEHQSCPAYGHLIAPKDKRQIPTSTKIKDGESMDSFAFALAKAKFSPKGIPRDLSELGEDPVLGKFVPESRYHNVSANMIYQNKLEDSDSLKDCGGRIILIGGHWNDLEGYGSLIDNHLSAAGMMSGLGIHANYIESLMNHAYAHEVPHWVDILADLLVGLGIYASFEYLRGQRRIFILLAASFAPFILAYISLISFNLYLDFLFPAELYLVHLAYELLEARLFPHRSEHQNDSTHVSSNAMNPLSEPQL